MTNWSGVMGRIAGKASLLLVNPAVVRFLKNIGITFLFKALSLVLTLVVYVLCVREFGVVTWGQVALISSASNILLIPLTFGLYYGVVRYVPVSDEAEAKELMGTALVGNIAIAAALAGLLALAAPVVERLTGFSATLWLWAIAVAASINLYILTESFLRGQQRFFVLGSYKLYCSIAFLAGVLVALYALGVKSIESYLLPFIGYNVLFFLCALWKSGLRSIRFTLAAWRKLFAFGAFIMMSTLFSTILFTSDLFFVAWFGSGYEVGIYSVYQNSIRGLCAILFHDVFAVVFMPMIAGMSKQMVDRTIVKYVAPITLAVAAGAVVVTTLLIWLYGKELPFNWLYVLLTAGGVAMNVLYLLFTSVIALDGVKAARLTFVALVVPLPLLLFMQFWFVREWGVVGGMASVIALNGLLVLALRLTIRFFYTFKKELSAP